MIASRHCHTEADALNLANKVANVRRDQFDGGSIMDVAKAIIIVGIIWAALFAWMFRYDVQSNNGFNAIRYDRWTGAVASCNNAECYRYKPWP